MKNLLIISSTKNSNFELSKDIKKFFDSKKDINCSIISLEQFNLPLYRPELEEDFKNKSLFPDDITKVKDFFLVSSDALIGAVPNIMGVYPQF